MSLAERKWLRIGTLLALYVAQGIPWGYTAITLPSYLGEHGVDQVAMSNAFVATTLPYTLKWVWGPIIDTARLPFVGTRFGRRRPWIVLAQLLMAVTIGCMLLVRDLDRDLILLAQLVLVHTVFNALQDVATDALAVDVVAPDERGRINGILYAGKYGGGLIGGAGLATLIAHTSLKTALVVQVSILLAIMLVPLLVAESNEQPPAPPRMREVFDALADGFATPAAFGLALIMLVLTFAQGMLSVVSTELFTQQLDWSGEKLAQLTGGYALAAGCVGGLVGAAVSERIGHRRLAIIASTALAVGWLVFALGEPYWHYDAFVYPLAIWETLCVAVMVVAASALCMSATTPAAGASQFAAYMALMNFASTLGYALPGVIPKGWSTRVFYFIAVGVQLGCVLLFVLLGMVRTSSTPPVRKRGYQALAILGAVLIGLTAYFVWRKLR